MPKVRSDQMQPLRSAHRLIDVLTSVSLESSHRSLAEISDELELAPSTVRRLLMVLEERGLLEHDRVQQQYAFTRLVECLGTIARTGRLVELATPTLRRLHEVTDETVISGARELDQGVHVDVQHASRRLVTAYRERGTRAPLWSGSAIGQVLLAWMPERQVRQVLPADDAWAAAGPATVDDLLAELGRVRRRGHAVNNGRTDPDAWAVAAPVRSIVGTVDLAVALVVPMTRAKRQRRTELVRAVVDAAADISELWQDAGAPLPEALRPHLPPFPTSG